MSRIDVPTLACDRCGHITQNTTEMSGFRQLVYYNISGKDEWDLCPKCWRIFLAFLRKADD